MNDTKSIIAAQIAAGIAGIHIARENDTGEKGLTFSPEAFVLPEACLVRVVPLGENGACSLSLAPAEDTSLASLIEKSLPAHLDTAPAAGNRGVTPSV